MEGLTGLLPGGYVDGAGMVHREFQLALLTGREEELLVQGRRRESASLVTTVLSRCVCRLGDISPLTEEVARQLLVADRQYLLLKLRQATFGDRVRANLFCPWPECGKRVAIEFSIEEVPVESSTDKGPVHTITLSKTAVDGGGEVDRQVSFRLPNGADQEALAPLLAENEAQALTLLLARCVRSIGRISPPGAELLAQLSSTARAEIEEEMAKLAPKVELDLETNCPECGRPFAAPFDLQRFFFGELRTSGDLLYREVHYLAYHYHWSEHEIMEMARDKRRQYIEVLADEIEKLNNGG